MRLRKYFFIISCPFIALLWLFVPSCSDLTGTDASNAVCVTFPKWPPDGDGEFPPLDYYRVRLVGVDGTKTFDVSNGDSIIVETDRGEVTAVIVQPITRHGETLAAFFRPAGCILPTATQATWNGGFAACLCEDLMRNTKDVSASTVSAILSCFNWNRFIQTVEAKCIDTNGEDDECRLQGAAVVCDPWTLDKKSISTKILSKDFPARNITPTTSKSNRTVQAISDLMAQSSLSSSGGALLPRYVPAYLSQRANGHVRLVSDKYAEGIDLKPPNMFLCEQSLVIFSVAINSNYEVSVTPLVMPMRDDVLFLQEIAP